MSEPEPLGLVLDEDRLRRAMMSLGIDKESVCNNWVGESRRLAELYLVDQEPTPRLTRPLELALIILTLMGMYGETPGETFGYEGACKRVFGDIGAGWILFGGDQRMWDVIGEARNYPLLQISPTYEETELSFNYLTGRRSLQTSTSTRRESKSVVGPDGVVANLLSVQTEQEEVSHVAVPNGAYAVVRARTHLGDQTSYLLGIEVNPIGGSIGGRAWKEPVEQSAATILAAELGKERGRYQVSPTSDDSNGNPDVRIQFDQTEVLVQHTTFEPQDLRVSLARTATVNFSYTVDDLGEMISKRLESKRQDGRPDRTLVLDAGFCIPSSPLLLIVAEQLMAKETGQWGNIWLLFRLNRSIHKLR